MTIEKSKKKEMLKEVIKELHAGASPASVRARFKEVLKDAKPEDIAQIEQELVKEGMPREELQRLCDVHLEVFAEQVEDQELHIPRGHPISILIEEHRVILEKAERLKALVRILEESHGPIKDTLTELQNLVKEFQDSEKHYLREENVLFPLLEKHDVTEPPAIMWMEHNRIRETEKKLYTLLETWDIVPYSEFKKKLDEYAEPLCKLFPDHFFKENNILFPTALQVVKDEEWKEARKEFDEVGYPIFTPPEVLARFEGAAKPALKEKETPAETWQFETGSLSKEEAEAILDTLPVDISFVDKNDRVKYFNKPENRIFVRTKAVIGRSVQMCHPQKSVHIVSKIVEAFTSGEKDTAEFWITMNNRLIHIRYFAIRDENRKYLGTLEMVQDLTDLKKIEGQKRLLDWKE